MTNRYVSFFATLAIACAGTSLAAAPPDRQPVAAEVDRLLATETAVDAAEPIPQVNDETFLRRAFLDLIGKPPTSDDVLAFAFTTSDDKRAELVDQLLADDDFGWHWARYWRDVIMYRRTEERAVIAVDSMTNFLASQFNENTPWGEIATAFITATGDVRENGDTGLIMAQAGRPEAVTAEVSRIFLGIQIQCAQCHDHPSDRWRREQFHELAAFFPRIAVRPDRTSDRRTFLVTVNDRPFMLRRPNNNNRFRGTPEHYMPNLEDPSDRGTRMQPRFFLTGATVELGAFDAQRRGTLTDWMTSTENPWFAKAFVNRIWAELIGEGFFEPVDDLGPDRECSAPETMEYLAKAFADSGYDVKWLYRTIMATEAYQRESRSRRGFEEMPFQANCAQRLRADPLFDSLLASLDLYDRVPDANPSSGMQLRRGSPRAVFNVAFGFDPSDPREEVGSSVQQALALMNSPFINRSINARRPDGLGAILQNHPDNKDALVELYLRTLSRGPSDYETRTCLTYIRQVGDRNEAFEDIQWLLINSTEFLHRK